VRRPLRFARAFFPQLSDAIQSAHDAGLAHMDMLADVRRRGLDTDFAGEPLQGRRQDADAPPEAAATRAPEKKLGATAADQPPANIDPDDVPF
jgi:hypothetical protein